MSGFGRKGLAPGQNAAPPTGFGRAGGGASTPPSGSASSPDQSAQLQAFLAEERQRRASVSGGALGGGIDDYGASHYHGQANYHDQNPLAGLHSAPVPIPCVRNPTYPSPFDICVYASSAAIAP